MRKTLLVVACLAFLARTYCGRRLQVVTGQNRSRLNSLWETDKAVLQFGVPNGAELSLEQHGRLNSLKSFAKLLLGFNLATRGARSSTLMTDSPESGRVAVVTGANKGIGYCIAEQLVEGGMFDHVVLGCRDRDRGEKAAAEVGGEFMQVDLSDSASIAAFADAVRAKFGRLDCLVNNAAIAFKASDPTPFAGQTGPTLKTNFYGTVELTELLLPLLRASTADPCIVNIASMAGHLRQLSENLQKKFRSESLKMDELKELVAQFEQDVAAGRHREEGWGNSNYGFSKLALIAATRVWACENDNILVNACCPGYCKTDMSSNKGTRPPAEGARQAVLLAEMEWDEFGPTGKFFEDMGESEW